MKKIKKSQGEGVSFIWIILQWNVLYIWCLFSVVAYWIIKTIMLSIHVIQNLLFSSKCTCIVRSKCIFFIDVLLLYEERGRREFMDV